MPVKRLRDVQVGEIIPMGGAKYKAVRQISQNNDWVVQKEVIPGLAYKDEPLSISQLNRILNGEGLNNNSLILVNEAKPAQAEPGLTEKLRGQVKQQELTAKLKAQVDATDEEDLEDRHGDEDDCDPYGYDYDDYDACDEDGDEEEDATPVLGFAPFNAGHAAAYSGYAQVYGHGYAQAGPTSGDVLKASLRAQVAQQGAGNASLRAQKAQVTADNAFARAEDVEDQLDGYRYDADQKFEDIDDRFEGVAHSYGQVVQKHNGLVDAVERHVTDLDSRVSKIEAEKAKEEKQMNFQQQLNARLAEQKRQASLQAQLDAKLNANKKSTFGGNGSMKNLLGSFTGQFGKVEGKFAFSPATGGLAIRKGQTGQFVAFDAKAESITDVQDFVLKFDVPAFSLPTAAGDVKKGDIIRNGDDYGYVTRVNDGFVEVVHVEKNQRGSVLPTKNILMGQSFYTVIKTLDAAGQGGFDPILLMALSKGESKDNLLPLLLMGGANGGAQAGKAGGIDPTMLMLLGDKVDDILPLVLMQQGGVLGGGAQGQGGIQSILPFLLMGDDKGSSKDMLPLLMMSGGLGGAQGQQAGGINPMMLMALGGDSDIDPMTMMMLSGGFGGAQGGLFGQQAQAQAPKADAKQEDSADKEDK